MGGWVGGRKVSSQTLSVFFQHLPLWHGSVASFFNMYDEKHSSVLQGSVRLVINLSCRIQLVGNSHSPVDVHFRCNIFRTDPFDVHFRCKIFRPCKKLKGLEINFSQKRP